MSHLSSRDCALPKRNQCIVPALLALAVATALAGVLPASICAADGIAVEITAPAAGAEVSGSVSVQVEARTQAAAIRSIEVKMGDLLATVEGPEGSVRLDAGQLEPGPYEIVAIAEDEAGNRGTARIEVAVVEAHPLRLWIESEPESIPAGDTFTVRVHLRSVEEAAGLQFVMLWDAALLALDGAESVTPGAAIPEGAPAPVVNAATEGRLVLVIVAPDRGFIRSETEVVTITMRALPDAPAGDLPLLWGTGAHDVVLCDRWGRLLDTVPEMQDGRITIVREEQ